MTSDWCHEWPWNWPPWFFGPHSRRTLTRALGKGSIIKRALFEHTLIHPPPPVVSSINIESRHHFYAGKWVRLARSVYGISVFAYIYIYIYIYTSIQRINCKYNLVYNYCRNNTGIQLCIYVRYVYAVLTCTQSAGAPLKNRVIFTLSAPVRTPLNIYLSACCTNPQGWAACPQNCTKRD